MKKLINDPADYVDQSVAGMVAAHPDHYALGGSNQRVVVSKADNGTGVGVVSGGGFGHLPLFAGYVGRGLLRTCAVGNVFAGPSFEDVSDAISLADRGSGVLNVIGNYGGDTMTFEMASDSYEGSPVETVVVADDVASAPPDASATRRGVAGLVLAFKIAGAAATAGYSLADAAAVTRRAMARCRSIGVGLSSATVPTSGAPTFTLDENTVEFGIGIHGEKGLWRGPLRPADELAGELLMKILDDLDGGQSDEVAVLVNGLGATPLDELYILYRKIAGELASRKRKIVFRLVGPFVTSMEMAGASLTLMETDDEILRLLSAETDCPHWRVQ